MSVKTERRRPRAKIIFCGAVVAVGVLWLVLRITAYPRWVEVRNSSTVVAKNVTLEVWDKDGKLIGRCHSERLSPSRQLTIGHSQHGVTATMSYTLDFGTSGYHERGPVFEHRDGWRFEILGNGVVLSQNADRESKVMKWMRLFFGEVY